MELRDELLLALRNRALLKDAVARIVVHAGGKPRGPGKKRNNSAIGRKFGTGKRPRKNAAGGRK
jgi:hypothetical protein